MVGYTQYSISLMSYLKYFLLYATKRKARVHQLGFIGAFIQANIKHKVFLKLDSRYVEYFPWHDKYFERTMRLKKSMYGMTNPRNIFSDELKNWLIDEAGFY